MKKFNSLKARLKLFRYTLIISITSVIIFLLYSILFYNSQYKQIIENLNLATEFNFEFKNQIDSKMYQLVIASTTFEKAQPYDDINEAKKLISGLKETASTQKNKDLVDGILRLVTILNNRVIDIEESGIFGSYDANIERLEKNIYITTDLIQEKLSEYIYNEARNLENLRLEIERKISRAVRLSIIASSALILIVWASIMFFSQSIIKPLNDLCDKTKQIGEGNFTSHSLESSLEELQVLSNHFNIMAK